MPRLTCHGGAGGVTGACYLLEIDDKKILIDCGLFQGERFAEEKNEEPFAFDPSTIDYLCVTHAHADHIGRIPKLYKEGFRGIVICTPPTKDLSEVMFADALKVMSHEVEDCGGTMLYEQEHVNAVLKHFHPHHYDTPITHETVTITLRSSAHILGAAMIEITHAGKTYVFTGDLGNTPSLFSPDMHTLTHTDYLLMESVYGNRLHEPRTQRLPILEATINRIHRDKGTLMIPAFALERTQVLLTEINHLINEGRIPSMPIFLDSPLAINTTEVYRRFPEYFNEEMQEVMRHDDIFDFPGLTLSPTKEDSKKINHIPGPKIIIAGNPHGYGSRIAHHFSRYLSDPKNAVMMVGYQVPRSLGRKITQGVRGVELFGNWVPIHAEIVQVSSYSAHADQRQLIEFVDHIQKPIKQIFLGMGDPESSEALRAILEDKQGYSVHIPTMGESIELE